MPPEKQRHRVHDLVPGDGPTLRSCDNRDALPGGIGPPAVPSAHHGFDILARSENEYLQMVRIARLAEHGERVSKASRYLDTIVRRARRRVAATGCVERESRGRNGVLVETGMRESRVAKRDDRGPITR
jgi:hypothetical protein